jgi:isoleucyl-tRNA synthetase
MKNVAAAISQLSPEAIAALEQSGTYTLTLAHGAFELSGEDVDVQTDDIHGMAVASERGTTLAVDLTLSPELVQEGLAREAVNRIQGLRKDSGLEITDRIQVWVSGSDEAVAAVRAHEAYLCAEVLADSLFFEAPAAGSFSLETDLEGHSAVFGVRKA